MRYYDNNGPTKLHDGRSSKPTPYRYPFSFINTSLILYQRVFQQPVRAQERAKPLQYSNAALHHRNRGAPLITVIVIGMTAAILYRPAYANAGAPEAVVKRIVDRINRSLNELDSGAVTDEKHTLELFRRELIPHVHAHLIARYVSTAYWDQAGTVEQAEFVSALSDYLLSTYSLLLTYGLKTGIEVLPDARARGSTAVVFAVLEAAGKDPADSPVPARRHDRCVEDIRRYRERREPNQNAACPVSGVRFNGRLGESDIEPCGAGEANVSLRWTGRGWR